MANQIELPSGDYVLPPITSGWDVLEAASQTVSFANLVAFLRSDAATHRIYPPAEDVFNALELTPLADVRVLLLAVVGSGSGAATTHRDGQGHEVLGADLHRCSQSP